MSKALSDYVKLKQLMSYKITEGDVIEKALNNFDMIKKSEYIHKKLTKTFRKGELEKYLNK